MLSTSARRRQSYASWFVLTVALLALVFALAPARPAFAAPLLVLKVELAPGTPPDVNTGTPFRYRLTYECSGTVASEVCTNMRVQSDPLPASLEGIMVVGNGDVTLAEFDPATRRATWEFKSPLAPGTTGQLEFEVRFVPGTTTDGTTGQITTTITAAGRTPVTIISPPITANAFDDTSAAKTLVSGGASGDHSIYRIQVCAGNSGALDYDNVSVVDTLPAGATYVSSNPPATVDTSGPSPVLTWSGIGTIEAGSCEELSVVVDYPKAANPVGGVRSNTATISGTPHGSATTRTHALIATHTLQAPLGGMTFLKTADADTIIGGTVVTALTFQNTGNVSLQNTVIDDPIPAEYDLTSIDTSSALAVSYQKNGGSTWYGGVALGTNIAVNGANFPGLAAGEYVSAVRFALGSVPVGAGDSGLRLRATVINPAHGSATPYALPHYVTNTAVANADADGAPLSARQDSATTEIETPKARPTPQKAVVSGSAVLPGEAIRYRLNMNNGSFLALDEPVIADLLPAGVEYVTGSWSYTPIVACPTQPAFQSIANYGGSGRTLLVWSWAGSGCQIPSSAGLPITFDVRVKPGTYPTGAMPNRFALVNYSTPATLVRTQRCDAAPPEASFFTTSAATGVDTSKLCWSPPSTVRINAAASIASAKQVRGQLDASFHRDPNTGATVQGGLITYSIALTNTGNVDFADLRIQDILPYHLPAPGNVSVRNQTPLGTAWTPQLAGPVIISPPIPGLVVRYSTETNPCRPELASPNPGCTPMRDEDDPGPGIWSRNLPTNPTAVRSLRFHFNSYVLKANESVRFTFPMFAPVDAPVSAPGPDGVAGTDDDTNVAWNTFAYSAVRVDDGNKLVAQPPRVGITVQPVPPNRASLGDYVWNDVDQDGGQNEPAFRGINGVVAELFQPGADNTPGTGDDVFVGTTVTRPDSSGDPGYYLFPALLPGDYFVRFTPPPGYTLTTPNATGDTSDSDADTATGRTAVVTLNAGDDNRTLDAGVFAPVVSIGNRVWFDTDNDGLDDDGAGGTSGSGAGIPNVSVELFHDLNGDGGLTGAERTPIATQLTDTTGFYRFDAQTHVDGVALGSPVPLYPGSYLVGVAPANFASGGPLAGYHSSGTQIALDGTPVDALAADPDAGGVAANPGVDYDENGDKQPAAALFYAGGVLSKAAMVLANEPLAEPEPAGTAPGGIAIDDERSNLTVDFGFYTASLGNTVWIDDGAGGGVFNNGVQDGGETGLAGATVRLFTDDGSVEIRVGPDGILGTTDDAAGGVTTPASGAYAFAALPQGDYVVRVTPPAGYASSKDIAGQTTSPNGNHDADDNGPGGLPNVVTSAAITLMPGSNGALGNNIVTSGSTLNPTVDFGFVRYYSLGNRVWADYDNSGTRETGEPGIGGVTLRLLAADGATRAARVDGTNVPDVTTDANGYYRFDNLPAGDYVIAVQAANFGSTLAGRVSSIGAGQVADPNTDVETDDNGLDAPVLGAIHSGVVTLGEAPGAAEPTTDTDGGPIAAGEAPDDQSNRTLDFGFFEPLSLGNRVWDDGNNNGRLDSGETGMPGMTVRLYRDTNGDDTPDDVNGDTVLDTADALATMTTNAGGHYLFTMLVQETYLVEIVPPPGYRTSSGNFNAYEPAPDADTTAADDDDNGSLTGAVIRSKGVTLTRGGEPTGETATSGLVDPARDASSNLAVDFGLFKPLSLGNRVWRDANNSGTIDAPDGATPGLAGLTVRLYRDSNNDGAPDDANGSGGVTTADAIQTATTTADGFYLFTGLGADTYLVDVVTPAGYTSSTGKTLPTPYETNVPDPDTNIDGDDNGVITSGVTRSRPVTLALTTEPTGEGAMAGFSDDADDDNGNYTVDFGFFPVMSLGNRVWIDANNSGTIDAADGATPGLNNVTVRLYRDRDDNGTPDDLNASGSVTTADAIRSTTTNSSGYYLFAGLDEDTYIVEIVAPAGYRGSTGPSNANEPGPDADTNPSDADDNGTGVTGAIRSQPITLVLDAEPTGEATNIADATADNRSNLTVDFGLFRPLTLGNLIFEDADNSGTYMAGTDRPLAGAVVSLFGADGTTPAKDVAGANIADITTTATGLYTFANLPPGDYVVKVTAPAGFRGSTGTTNTYEPGPDADTNSADNDDNGTGAGANVTSLPVTLTSGFEPTVDGDGADGNLTLDFGFWHPVSLGNLVFADNDNSATYNPLIDDEIAGATVTLFKGDGTTPAVDVNGTAVPAFTTLGDGLYAFGNLPPGDYVVRVTPPAGYRSSNDIASTTSPNANADGDDNGVGTGANVASLPITLTSGGEPGAAGDGDDINGNQTLDFGFVRPVSLGNLVWDDADNDALFDAGEQPIAGATVMLFKADGTTGTLDMDDVPVLAQTTLADGRYAFGNLRPGQYVVRVTPPPGYNSSKDIAATITPDGDADGDDNGEGSGVTAQSRPITLVYAGEPTTDEDGPNGNTTLDFGFVRRYSLGNRVWFDTNNSGAVEAGETGIQNVALRLFAADGTTQASRVDGTLVPDAVTDANGYYRFDMLPPGEYVVAVLGMNFSGPLTGHVSSTGIAQQADPDTDFDADDNGLDALVFGAVQSGVVTLGEAPGTAEPTLDTDGGPIAAGEAPDAQSNRTVDFGFFTPVNLGNLVFEDVDNSGTYVAGTDRPLAGAVVTLWKADGTTPATNADGAAVASITTTATGLYNFTNLAPGEYVVKVAAPVGYRGSTGPSSGYEPGPDADTNGADDDDNGSGTGVNVASQPVTLTSRGEPTGDGDGADGNLTLDFGFWHPVSLGNLVFRDLDGDSRYDAANDQPLPGATVTLFMGDGTTLAVDADGVPVPSITTPASGLYTFTNLAPGGYVVTVTAPAGYTSSADLLSTTAPNGNIDDDDNGEGIGATASSRVLTLSSGDEPNTPGDEDGPNGNTTLDFGFVQPVSLGNLVFEDADNNGAFDALIDRPLPGAVVTLYKGDGTTPAVDVNGATVADVTTLADGRYSFANLTPGQYVVRVAAPAGFRSSNDIAGTATPDGDGDGDDNGPGVAGTVTSAAITLVRDGEPASPADEDGTSGNTTLDFGFWKPLSLGDLVFEDRDDSGSYDSAAEQGLAGAVVTLFLGDGTTPATDADGALVPAQTTSANGLYLFINLAPGDYVVRASAPSGYRSSTDVETTVMPNGDRNDDDNGAGVAQSARSQPVTLRSGREPVSDGDDADGNLTLDFGFLLPASIGDRVWLDANRDGVQDVGETGLPGFTVHLYRPGPDGLPGTADDELIGTRTTGASGDYLFADLPAGSYFLEFEVPAGYSRSAQDAGADDTADSDADPATGRTALTTLDPGEHDDTWDAGMDFTAGLGDRVWLDRDADGVQDAGEPGVPGVLVRLLDGAGVPTGATAITNAGGFYSFPFLAPGDYRVEFVLPGGYIFSPQDQGPDDTADSDADPADGRTATTTIVLNESDPDWDAGLYRLVSLGNLVWEDADNDGRVSAGEHGMAGVLVQLFRDANGNGQAEPGEFAADDTTDAAGIYGFGGLVPGEYIVVLPASNFASGAPLAGYASSTGRHGPATGPFEPAPDPDADSDDGDDGSANTGAITALPVTLWSDAEPITDGDADPDSNLSVDFGVFMPASLGSTVWHDQNRDGRRDTGEPGVGGVTVTLYDANGAVVATTVTDTNGSYLFRNLVPGGYTVGFSGIPTGFVFTTPNQGADTFDSDADPQTGRTGTITLVPGQNDPSVYAGINQPAPTAITLDRFSATRREGTVVVEWVTSREVDTWGYDLYRSASGRRADAERVTARTILAQGRGQGGATYRWTDLDVRPDVTYTYWLVETETSGALHEYGPVSTASHPTDSANLIFLPLTTR
jgi:uncharacterized repeat protein (TIGR01451 family)